jgi:archaeal flagellar protein FlaJ
MEIVKLITRKFAFLHDKLRKAKMSDSPEEFVKKTLISSVYTSIGIEFIIFMFLVNSVETLKLTLITVFTLPVVFLFIFFYFFQIPIVKISKIDKEINKEIIFAGRFLIVEIESGVTLYDAMKNLPRNYPSVGAYFQEIINKINIGTTMEDALTEIIEICPNSGLIKIFWQISNSLRTGGDIAEPLKNVIQNIIKEQQIMVNEYAKKLNPLAMFYMLIAIIMPSLGVTMLTIISIFVGLKLNLLMLLLIACVNAFIQFMFVAMITSSRPPVEF